MVRFTRLVGGCCINAYKVGEAVLGLLPDKYRFLRLAKHDNIPAFQNIETGEITLQDPRLEGCSTAVKNALWEHGSPNHDPSRAALISALDEVGMKYEKFVLV